MTTPKRKSVQDLDLKSLARGYTTIAVQTLGGVAQNGESEAARVSASIALLDRGWGKPNQPHDAKLDGELRITIRKLLTKEEGDA
jgi:hypothetical protein